MNEVEERLIELPDGAALLLRVGGAPSGLPVLLCHPHTGNARSWRAQEEALIAAGYRVIAYSRRFHAGSVPGPESGSYGGDALAVMDALGIARAACIGVAAGGGVVVDLLMTAPERVAGAVISSSVMGLADPALGARIEALRPEGFAELPHALQELGPSYRFSNPAGVAEWDALRAENTLRGRQSFATRPTPEGLAAIACPILLMTGSADLFLPPTALAEVARTIPQAQVRVLPEAGHAPHVEVPDAFNAAVLEFLRGLA